MSPGPARLAGRRPTSCAPTATWGLPLPASIRPNWWLTWARRSPGPREVSPDEHRDVQAVDRLEQRTPHLDRVGVADVRHHRFVPVGGPRPAWADDWMGAAVLAHHRRLLQGQAERSGVGDGWSAAVVRDPVRAHQRPSQLLLQRFALLTPTHLPGRRCGESDWHTRVLDDDVGVRRPC